ncbi:hypothetical protein OIU77_011333 [Salix suchowensis]|uniref:Uncharacterized protein n=1 Tax=Salix suchowensis TaxID=1278906 RepID=A0ABQ8ZZT7_9ROSI|nr:hypothetical protein OIU77_011333 [Salix suchowensis]
MTTQLTGHTQPIKPSSHHTLKVIMKGSTATKPTDQVVETSDAHSHLNGGGTYTILNRKFKAVQEVPAAEEALARAAKGKMKEVADNVLTVNNSSSHPSQASLDEEESSANTVEAGGQTDGRDTSPGGYTKVRKKKGGKNHGKGTGS